MKTLLIILLTTLASCSMFKPKPLVIEKLVPQKPTYTPRRSRLDTCVTKYILMDIPTDTVPTLCGFIHEKK